MTEAGKRLLDLLHEADRGPLADTLAADWEGGIAIVEAEAVAAERVRIVAGVRAEAGPLCVCPDEEMPVCETHSELCFDGHCEDFPTWLPAVLRIIEGADR